MRGHLSVLLAGPSLFVLATAAVAQPAKPPVGQSADPATTAQEANEAAEERGEDGAIIITARRRAESLLDVPQTVQAVTSKDLQEYNLFKFEDIAQLVSGLTLVAPTGGIFVGASVRGTTFSITSQGSPTVESYFNEHPVQSTLMFQGQFDVGQIEVLKGPQGTMRGRSSPSGAMTLTTRRPDLNEVGGSVSMTGTSRGGINIQAAVGIPIIQDVLAIRVAGLIDENEENGVKSSTTNQEPSVRTRAFRATVRFEPTDTLSAVVMYQRLEKRAQTFGGILFSTVPGQGAVGINTNALAGALTDDLDTTTIGDACVAPGSTTPGQGSCGVLPGGRPRIFAPPNFNGGGLVAEDYMSIQDFPDRIKQNADVLTAQIDWRFAGQRLSYVGGYSKILQDDSGGGGDASNTIVGAQTRPIHLATSFGPEKRLTNELRLSSDERLFAMFDYTLGAYHSKTTGHTVSVSSAMWAGAFGSPLGASAIGGPGVLTPFTFSDRYGLDSLRTAERKEIEKAVFANVLAHLFDDKLELEAGGRFIWFDSTKSQLTFFERGLQAIRNPNGLGACPATLSGINNAGATFIDQRVVGSTFPGTCDVQMTLNSAINPFGGIRTVATDTPLIERKFDTFVYRLGASYHFTPDHMAYVSYGTAWRPGPGPITGIVPNCAAANDSDGGAAHPDPLLCSKFNFLDPDTSKSIEIGVKGAFFDRRLNVTVAAYKQKFSGFFVQGSGFALTGTCAYPHLVNVTNQPAGCNAGNAGVIFNAPLKGKGVDAEFNFRVSEDFNFGGSASWADSKFSGGQIPCGDRTFDGLVTTADTIPQGGITANQFLNSFSNVNGTPVPDSAFGVQLCTADQVPALKPNSSPKWNFNVRGEFSHEVFTGARGFLRALFNYTPKNKNLNPVTSFIPKPYGLLNLFAGLRGDNGAWEVSVSGRNILNKKTLLSRGTGAAGTGQSLTRPIGGPTDQANQLAFSPSNLSGYTTISFVARREFQVSARFAFGSR